MSATLNGKTAGGIVKTAKIQQMRAGNFEIVVTHPHECIASIGERKDGWGGTVADVLVLMDASGLVAKLPMSDQALKKMRALEAEIEAKHGH